MDGKIVAWDEAKLHVLSHGLNYASCVFEGERIYNGKIFKLVEHTQRLLDSARLVGFELPYSLDQLCDATDRIIAARGLKNGYVRPLAWRGHEDLAVAGAVTKIHVAITALGFDDITPPEVRKAGINLKISSWVRPAPNMAPIRAKAASNYMLGGLAGQEAKDAGFNDALMLDLNGNVAESTGSNFFMVKGGILMTPPPDYALNGITRQTVLQLTEKLGINVIVAHFRPEEITNASEAFLTGTAFEIMPIRRVNEVVFSDDRPVTEVLAREYFRLVGKV